MAVIESHSHFLADFFPTLEKMLSNGYTQDQLTHAPMAEYECKDPILSEDVSCDWAQACLVYACKQAYT